MVRLNMPDTSRSVLAIGTRNIVWRCGLLLCLNGTPVGHAATCTVTSDVHKTALLELYSSEGCDSCPPADRWISALPATGLIPSRLIPLAFHVDYWDRLGWKDPFAKNQFTVRQQNGADRDGTGFIYTPQFKLDGRDYRRATQGDELLKSLARINRNLALVTIQITLDTKTPHSLQSRAELRWIQKPDTETDFFIALYENNIRSDVKTGENAGRILRHDFVVRALAGPFTSEQVIRHPLEQTFNIDPKWNPGNLGIAAFVQRRDTAEIIQATATPVCSQSTSR